jgi:ATP-binding cassette subfamily C protein EexD
MLVGNWKGFTVARLQYNRLGQVLNSLPEEKKSMPLPPPQGRLTIENLVLTPPLSQKVVVRGISLKLDPGTIMGVVGPSASGKSCFARGVLGVWPSHGGKVRLDGVDIATWNRAELGPYLGYLPQDIELFDGSVSENICRFMKLDANKIISAATAAGVHDMILSLPEGYETIIDRAGGALSGGQRQRIGLARALYGEPKLLVLDEPNSNLDDQGEKALFEAIKSVASTGTSVIVITHRTGTLAGVDKILVMKDGVAVDFGPRDQVLKNLAAGSNRKEVAHH